MVARATTARHRMPTGRSTDPSIQLGTAGRAMHRRRMSPVMATARHHLPWCVTIAALGHTMHGCKVRAFHRNTGGRGMWSTTGGVTVCTNRRTATTGCNTAVITCWWQLRQA